MFWISRHTSCDKYLRQIDVPGVDTKFIESHRGILSASADAPRPVARRSPGPPSTSPKTGSRRELGVGESPCPPTRPPATSRDAPLATISTRGR